MSKYLSIEAEATGLRVAEIEEHSRGGRIISCFTIRIPSGAVEDGQIRDTGSLAELLRGALNERRIRTRKVWCVVNSNRIASREVKIPAVKKNRIQSIIEANATDYFPIDVTKYVLTYSLLGTTGGTGAKKETEEKPEENTLKQHHLVVYAAPKSISAAYQEFVQKAGLTLVGIDSVGDSIYQAAKSAYVSGIHMLVKIEMNTTGITIIRDGRLALQRTLNYGVGNAVETLRMLPEFSDIEDTNEAIDCLCSRSCLLDTLDGDIETTREEEALTAAKAEVTESFRYLIGSISRIMDYYISRNTGVTFDSIACCGLGGIVDGLDVLLTNELGQPVEILQSLNGYAFSKKDRENDFCLYSAVLAPSVSGLNLLDKVSPRQKDEKDNLRGALFVLVIGTAAGAALCAAGIANRLYQQHSYESLNDRISEESSIEEIYNAWTSAATTYENYQKLYAWTETPNDQLREFLEEMEEKMPADIAVESFGSTGTEVSFTARLANKNEAANALIQLRSFESLSSVTTTGIEEEDDASVTMRVTCTYADASPADIAEGE